MLIQNNKNSRLPTITSKKNNHPLIKTITIITTVATSLILLTKIYTARSKLSENIKRTYNPLSPKPLIETSEPTTPTRNSNSNLQTHNSDESQNCVENDTKDDSIPTMDLKERAKDVDQISQRNLLEFPHQANSVQPNSSASSSYSDLHTCESSSERLQNTNQLSSRKSNHEEELKSDLTKKPETDLDKTEKEADQILQKELTEFFHKENPLLKNSSVSTPDLHTCASSFERLQNTSQLSSRKSSNEEDLLEKGLSDFFSLVQESSKAKEADPSTPFHTPVNDEEDPFFRPVSSPSVIKLPPKNFPLLIKQRQES